MTKSIKEKTRLAKIKHCQLHNIPVPVECIKVKMSYKPYSEIKTDCRGMKYRLLMPKKFFNHGPNFIREYLGINFKKKITLMMQNIANSMKVYKFKINFNYYGNDSDGYITFVFQIISNTNFPIGTLYIDGKQNHTFLYRGQYSNEPEFLPKTTLPNYLDEIKSLSCKQITLAKIVISVRENMKKNSYKFYRGSEIPNKEHRDIFKKIRHNKFLFYNLLKKNDLSTIHIHYSDIATWSITIITQHLAPVQFKPLESFNEIELLKTLIAVKEIKTSIEEYELTIENLEYIKEIIRLENY